MRRLIRLIGPLLLASCDGLVQASGSTSPEGAYALRPGDAVVLQNSSVRIDVLADTLWLRADGIARRVVRERVAVRSLPDTTVAREEPYRYQVSGESIELEYVCPPNALCSPPPHLWGRITPHGLALRAALDPRALLLYDRVRR